MDCPKCKAANQSGSRCGACGASLIQRANETATIIKSVAGDPAVASAGADPGNGPALASVPSQKNDVLRFRRFITPIYIEIIFWIGLLGVLGNVLFWSIGLGQRSVIAGVLIFIIGLPIGVIGWRISCELLIVVFRIHEELRRSNVGRP